MAPLKTFLERRLSRDIENVDLRLHRMIPKSKNQGNKETCPLHSILQTINVPLSSRGKGRCGGNMTRGMFPTWTGARYMAKRKGRPEAARPKVNSVEGNSPPFTCCDPRGGNKIIRQKGENPRQSRVFYSQEDDYFPQNLVMNQPAPEIPMEPDRHASFQTWCIPS